MNITYSMQKSTERGFSILELVIAMAITLSVMAAATTLLATSLRTRGRENTRSEALASTQRALNIMSREIGNSGYGLADNGIVLADSGTSSIRVRANLDNDSFLTGADEVIRYIFQNPGGITGSIVRYDNSLGAAGNVVLATNISGLVLTYFDVNGIPIMNAANYASAERLTIEVKVDLPAGLEQPASTVKLVSDVALRNAPNTLESF
jgi:prepilin-type N-terminal cleavage/methylation domain-containing protein